MTSKQLFELIELLSTLKREYEKELTELKGIDRTISHIGYLKGEIAVLSFVISKLKEYQN